MTINQKMEIPHQKTQKIQQSGYIMIQNNPDYLRTIFYQDIGNLEELVIQCSPETSKQMSYPGQMIKMADMADTTETHCRHSFITLKSLKSLIRPNAVNQNIFSPPGMLCLFETLLTHIFFSDGTDLKVLQKMKSNILHYMRVMSGTAAFTKI